MLGLGGTILSPYVADAGYANSHSLSLDGAGSGSDADFLDTNTTLQAQIRNSFSVSCWAKLDDGRPDTSRYFFGASTSGNIVGLSVSTAGSIGFTHFANGDIALESTNTAVFSDGATDWTHVGVVVTETGGDTGYKIYVNGSQVASSTLLGVSAANHSQYTSSVNLAFGALGATTASGGLDGLIDECAFFDDALTDGEMSAIGGGGAPTDITGHDHLFLYYKLNNSTTDEVGNSNGSLNGQAAFSTTTP
tara:strand:+ start:63 stop:809 length:747 start_codon:yes stop_codon:yes gene_type:complete